ncbi:MAG: cell division protein FtsZ [Dehalococcoidia bacterium]|nr:cell division protein FtsZ [Chloroflexota bacterium]MCK4242579.1 cell division protein FtsZ [Dehalococcoidia bacterium]
MKFVVIGLGQCGGRIADEFAVMNRRAQSERRVRIITGAYAVNTDEADLSGLTTISSDYQHRILLGGRKTTGHGVGKINELGAEIAREGGDKIIDAIRATKRFYETDAFLIVAAAAGGTGSGSLPIVTQLIKERYRDKPVYALAVLPFEHEVNAEARGVYNTATCLKSVYQVADAIFLADNQRYLRKDSSLKNNMDAINKQIVAPFYNLLCAGEEKKRQYIGARVVDAGDIIQTLGGWSTIGFGASALERLKVPIEKKRDFRKKGAETLRGLQAMDEALSELSLDCRPEDARSAIYLLSAPAKEMNMDVFKEIGDYLRELAPHATIRSGDYPRQRGEVNVTLILSNLSDVSRITEFYYQLRESVPMMKKWEEEAEAKFRALEEAWEEVPVLSLKGNHG